MSRDDATYLYECCVRGHDVQEIAHLDLEEFMFHCRTCDAVLTVFSERVYIDGQ